MPEHGKTPLTALELFKRLQGEAFSDGAQLYRRIIEVYPTLSSNLTDDVTPLDLIEEAEANGWIVELPNHTYLIVVNEHEEGALRKLAIRGGLQGVYLDLFVDRALALFFGQMSAQEREKEAKLKSSLDKLPPELRELAKQSFERNKRAYVYLAQLDETDPADNLPPSPGK